MRSILIVSQLPLVRELGAAKVVVELAAALRHHGVRCELVGPSQLKCAAPTYQRREPYLEKVNEFFRREGASYDVVEFDHEWFPFERAHRLGQPLRVARSVLLVHHFEHSPVPVPRTARSLVGRLLFGRRRRREWARRIAIADTTIAHADLLNLSNREDAAELARRGVPAERMTILPFGLSRERHDAFATVEPSAQPCVAFVGTFDYRKGATDFPAITRRVWSVRPDTKFRLLGTGGLFATEAGVRAFFPRAWQGQLEVVPHYPTDTLPERLAGCAAGLFPSYVEGFPFGVLEMLTAGLPVAAYDAPGPPEMLPQDWIVRRGDPMAIAQRILEWLQDPDHLRREQSRARELAARFLWHDIAAGTIDTYERSIRVLRDGAFAVGPRN